MLDSTEDLVRTKRSSLFDTILKLCKTGLLLHYIGHVNPDGLNRVARQKNNLFVLFFKEKKV